VEDWRPLGPTGTVSQPSIMRRQTLMTFTGRSQALFIKIELKKPAQFIEKESDESQKDQKSNE
jgi:hypothetical protein